MGTAVRMTCTNASCTFTDDNQLAWMHDECFDKFEDMALTALQKTGRARNWTSTQAIANLWTKKGYDVVIKSCGCACDAGFVRKDLDYRPPVVQAAREAEAAKPKKKKDQKQEEERKKEMEKKAKKVAKRLMEEEASGEDDEVEYFDRPGSVTLDEALGGTKSAEQREKEKKDLAEKQRMLAKQREEEERHEMQRQMAMREHERQEQEKAAKRAKEAERREAVEKAEREAEEQERRKVEEEERKNRQREKQKQRDEEKRREQARIEAEANERRKKFMEQQRMKEEQEELAKREADGEDVDEDMSQNDDAAEQEAFWMPAPDMSDDLSQGPPGFSSDTTYTDRSGHEYGMEAEFVGDILVDEVGAGGSQANKMMQAAKLQAQVTKLREHLARAHAELVCEQKLRELEEERLEGLTLSMTNRVNGLQEFQARWAAQLQSL